MKNNRKLINDLLCDSNPAEIANQIERDNLSTWIKSWKAAMGKELDKAFGPEEPDEWVAVRIPLPLSDGTKDAYWCPNCRTTWDNKTPCCPFCGKEKKEGAKNVNS